MFTLRFDMRVPDGGPATARELYAAALDMSEWADARGCLSIYLSEHHASPDGYLPSPVPLAAAVAARTQNTPIQIAAILLPFYDPVRLAEDMAIVDLSSAGRVSYVAGLGYRAEEFEMFGIAQTDRVARLERCIGLLKNAFRGEPFEFEGRRIQVTPKPATPGGPEIWMGGNTKAAARRAARLDMGFLAQGGDASLQAVYEQACRQHEREPGPCIVPPPGTVTCAFIAESVDQGWAEFGEFMLHDARMYAQWMSGERTSASKSTAATIERLRAENGPYRVFTPDAAIEYIRSHGVLLLQPLCGGVPPEIAWKSLKLMDREVLPKL